MFLSVFLQLVKSLAKVLLDKCRGVAQPGSALVWGASGRRFKSSRPDHFIFFVVFCLLSILSCSTQNYSSTYTVMRRPVYYLARSGDTGEKICKHFSLPQERLLRLNNLKSIRQPLVANRRILLGYRLIKPGEHSSDLSKALRKGDGRLAWPLTDGRIVSGYGPRNQEFHDGLDIAAERGTKVRAAQSGEVVYADDDLSGFGKVVIIQGSSKLATVYAHNDRILVSPSQKIKKGDIIAEVGDTGRASGTHLHFEVRLMNTMGRYVTVDPLPLLETGQKKPRWRINGSLNAILAKKE